MGNWEIKLNAIWEDFVPIEDKNAIQGNQAIARISRFPIFYQAIKLDFLISSSHNQFHRYRHQTDGGPILGREIFFRKYRRNPGPAAARECKHRGRRGRSYRHLLVAIALSGSFQNGNPRACRDFLDATCLDFAVWLFVLLLARLGGYWNSCSNIADRPLHVRI